MTVDNSLTVDRYREYYVPMHKKAVGVQPTKGKVKFGELTFEVEIKEVKTAYGRNRYLVVPVSGTGEVWVEKVILEEHGDN